MKINTSSTGNGNPDGGAFTGLGRFDRACHIPPEIQPATPPPGLFGPDGALPWDRFPGYMPPPDWLFPEPSLPSDVKPPWGMIPPGLPQPMGLWIPIWDSSFPPPLGYGPPVVGFTSRLAAADDESIVRD